MKKTGIFPFRSIVLYVIIMFAFGLLPVRLFVLSSNNVAADSLNNSKSIEISQSRGIIYDADFNRLVAAEETSVSVAKPTPQALSELKKVLKKNEFNAVSEQFAKSNPVLLAGVENTDCNDIKTIKIYKRYNENSVATHLIGYLDSSQTAGISGIEKSYNSFLSQHSGSLRARFFTQADGECLPGADIEIVNENYNSISGIVLTLKLPFQKALEAAMDECGITKGAAVIVDVQTGAIAAMVSRPDYDRENIAAGLEDADLPLYNRALGAYPVGSVFKPLVALAALESGVNPANSYNCGGYTDIGSKRFNCTKAHGSVNMAQAICYSCNCYFINLLEGIGCNSVLELAAALGFGKSAEPAAGIKTYSGNLPQINELDSQAARANFSFGQGSLTANVLQVAGLYAAIANGGNYYSPYLYKGLCGENMQLYNEHENTPPYKLFSEKSADLLSSFLEVAVREGTGKNAAVDEINVCGKTATAQSGEFINGSERLVTWFAGFYPYEKPEYALVVMCENGVSGATDCAPVFSKTISNILNNIY